MEMGTMVTMIVGITVSIIIFISVMTPVILDATDSTSGALKDNSTWSTLVTVCGTLTIIAILMIVVRSVAKKND